MLWGPFKGALAAFGGLFGLMAWWQLGGWIWLLGAALILANASVTFHVMMPVNDWLMATASSEAGLESRALIARWGRLHVLYSGPGLAASLTFLVACLQA